MDYKEDPMGKVKNYITLLQIMIMLSLHFQVVCGVELECMTVKKLYRMNSFALKRPEDVGMECESSLDSKV